MINMAKTATKNDTAANETKAEKPAITLAIAKTIPGLADAFEPMESALDKDACKIRAERHAETDLRPALETVLGYEPGAQRSVAMAMLRFELGLNVASSNNARPGDLSKQEVSEIRNAVTAALPFRVSVRASKAAAIDMVSLDALDALEF